MVKRRYFFRYYGMGVSFTSYFKSTRIKVEDKKMNKIENDYVETVYYEGFIPNPKAPHPAALITFDFKCLFNKQEDFQNVEAIAQKILIDYKFTFSDDGLRYQFKKLNREKLLKIIFEMGYDHAPDKIINAAQCLESAQ